MYNLTHRYALFFIEFIIFIYIYMHTHSCTFSHSYIYIYIFANIALSYIVYMYDICSFSGR